MLNREKEATVLQWLACYNIKVQAVSELQNGLQLLKLLSPLDRSGNSENVDPSQTLAFIEKILCEQHGFLPAHFLTNATKSEKGGCSLDIAVAAVLSLSALAFRATSCSPTSEVAPLLHLDTTAQYHIKELMEIVYSGEDVLDAVRAYLQVGVEQESPPSAPLRAKRLKSSSFTLSPSARSPLRQLSPSPQQLPPLPTHLMQELRMLREHIRDEERANSELRQETAQLKQTVKNKDKQIRSMHERIRGLQMESSEQSDAITTMQDRLEQLQAQNKFLEDKGSSLGRIQDDYDTIIRQNVSLQSENERLSGLQEECEALRESLAATMGEMSRLASRLSSEEEQNRKLSAELAEKTRDLEATLDLYSKRARQPPFLNSPTCKSPESPRISCYQELLLVDLQEANAQLKQESARVQSELEAVSAKLQTDNNALKATILHLEQSKVDLCAKVSQLGQHCSQLDSHVASLEAELLASKTMVAKLESELSIRSTQTEGLQLELASKDQEIATLDAKSASYEASNGELLKSNEQLKAALQLSEAEKAEHLNQLHEVAAENEKHQELLSQQLATGRSLDEAAKQLRAQLCEAVEKEEALLCQLASSREENAKLEEASAATRLELAESLSRSTALQEALSRVEHEKDDQQAQLSETMDKLKCIGCISEQLKARVQELESSERHLHTHCSELRLELSEREGQLKAATEGKDTVVKMMEEVQAAHVALRMKFDLASQEHSATTTFLQQQADEHKNAAIKLHEEKQAVLQSIAVLEARLEQLHDENARLAQSHDELNSKLCEKNAQIEKMTEEYGRLLQSMQKDAAEKEVLEDRLRQEQKATHELEEKCAEQASLIEKLRAESLALRTALEEAGVEKRSLEAGIKEVGYENSQLRSHLEATKANLDAAVAENQSAKLKLSEKSATCAALQDSISTLRAKLAASEEQEQALRTSSARSDSFAAACKDQLQARQALLDKAAAEVQSFRQEISILQQAVTRLNLEKEFLHSSLGTAENTTRFLNEACAAATRTVSDMKQRLEESDRDRSHAKSVVEQLQQECASLKIVLSDTNEKLLLSKREAETARIESGGLAALSRELEDERGVLKHRNQVLEDHIGDLEVKLNSQLQLQRKAEDDYYECVKERDAHKESLNQQIDELTAEVTENARLQQELEELRRALNTKDKESATEAAQLRADKERLELDLANKTNELHKATTKCDELHLKCRILENKNEGLKYELKTANEVSKKRVQAAMVSINAGYNEKISDIKRAEASLRDEVSAWREKYQNERALRERREAVLTRHMGEMKEGIEHSSKDISALKTQLAEQNEQLAAIKQERDRLVVEKRSLQAQVSFCDAKLREHTRPAKTGRATNESIHSTPSLESLWSQRQPTSTRQSQSSLSSIDQFKVPVTWRGNPRRESRSGPLAQALDSSIFSESRFSCDVEQDLFSETTLADLTSTEEDPMGRYSELYRRNSMVPSHLKSCYPVEMQQSSIPATPLKGEGTFVYPPVLGQVEDATKRKRPTQSSSSDEGASKPIWM